MLAHKPAAVAAVGDIPPRPPNFCTGCPERPVFAAIKLAQREIGPTHISADIGCHSFATFAPFSLGNSILGYGMSLASAAAVGPNMEKRPIAMMGDGGFWHNGLITGVASNMFNKGDGVLIVMQNGYASATGQQYLPSSTANRSGTPTGISIEKTLRSLGVTWLRTVRTYSVGKMAATLKEAMRTAERGLKVIIADGECMLARQRVGWFGYGMSLASAAAVGPNMAKRSISIMGDGGFWHNGLITGVASNMFNKGDGVLIVMQNGYASATGQQYLPSSESQPQRHADRHQHRKDVALARRHLAAYGAHLQRCQNDGDAEGGDAHRRARSQSHHRRRRMHAGASAPHPRRGCREAQARRARGEDALRRRRRNLHRRSFLHPAVRLPVADGQAQSRSAAQRSGGGRDRKLRRLRAVRRGRARRRAVPVVLSHRCHQQSELVGSHAVVLRSSVIGWLRGAGDTAASPAGRGRGEGLGLSAIPDSRTPSPQPSPLRGEGVRISEPQSSVRPLTVLIAALGGEGGGVLTDWIVAAAASQNFPVQSTSIPGVAQRTGATTYHIEMVPAAWPSKSDKRRPILALAPGVGDVDLVVASELMEAGRAIAGGFVTPDRTTTIASTSRSYLVVEKMAMGDGRYDQQRLVAAVEKNSKGALLLDLEAIARESGAMINAVMLGAIAGAGALPIPAEAFEAAIRADGKAVDANLRGFRAGFDAARGGSQRAADPRKRHSAPAASLADLESEIERMPEAARAFMTEGVRRLAAYQDLAYARLYLDRLGPIRDADAKAGADGQLLAETARHLAVRMSYEDVIRVAQAKIDPARFAPHRAQMGVKPDQPFTVTEFFKPGVEEFCSVLPPWLARPHSGVCRTSSRARPRALGHGDQYRVDLRLSALLHPRQAARASGRKTFRYQEEQRAIEAGCASIVRAAPLVGRTGDRNRRMRAPHQRLWRHPQARQRQLSADRDASDPAGARRRDAGRGKPRKRSPMPAPRRCSIRKARRWRNASPTSAAQSSPRIAAE